MSVLAVLGSPAAPSRSAALATLFLSPLEESGVETSSVSLREVGAEALAYGRVRDPRVRHLCARVARARVLVIATPIYKAGISGGLKCLLDLLPERSLAGKVVVPIATSGSAGHFLALEYGLKPVLSALGARHILGGVYATDADVALIDGSAQVSEGIRARLDSAAGEVLELLNASPAHADASPLGRRGAIRCISGCADAA